MACRLTDWNEDRLTDLQTVWLTGVYNRPTALKLQTEWNDSLTCRLATHRRILFNWSTNSYVYTIIKTQTICTNVFVLKTRSELSIRSVVLNIYTFREWMASGQFKCTNNWQYNQWLRPYISHIFTVFGVLWRKSQTHKRFKRTLGQNTKCEFWG